MVLLIMIHVWIIFNGSHVITCIPNNEHKTTFAILNVSLSPTVKSSSCINNITIIYDFSLRQHMIHIPKSLHENKHHKLFNHALNIKHANNKI